MAVVDASVYVALVNNHEPGYTASWAWFEEAQAGGEVISAPSILLPEVASALRRGAQDPALAGQVIAHLLRTRLVELVAVAEPLAERAAALAADHRIRGCDAVYVALAEQLGEELVTLDDQQLARGGEVVATRRP